MAVVGLIELGVQGGVASAASRAPAKAVVGLIELGVQRGVAVVVLLY